MMKAAERIAELRFDDPASALKLALDSFRGVTKTNEAMVLACEVGSCLKSTGKNFEARRWLEDAAEWATKANDRRNRGNALWRLAQVEIREGKLEQAYWTSGEAIVDGAAANCLETEGRGFHTRAAALHHLGMPGAAYFDVVAASERLKSNIDLAVLAISLHQLANDLKISLSSIPKVKSHLLPSGLRANYLWIEAERSPAGLAVQRFSVLLDFYLHREDWTQAALAGVEAIDRLIAQNRTREVRVLTDRLRPLIFKLEKTPLVSEALASLVRAALLSSSDQSGGVLRSAASALRKALARGS